MTDESDDSPENLPPSLSLKHFQPVMYRTRGPRGGWMAAEVGIVPASWKPAYALYDESTVLDLIERHSKMEQQFLQLTNISLKLAEAAERFQRQAIAAEDELAELRTFYDDQGREMDTLT